MPRLSRFWTRVSSGELLAGVSERVRGWAPSDVVAAIVAHGGGGGGGVVAYGNNSGLSYGASGSAITRSTTLPADSLTAGCFVTVYAKGHAAVDPDTFESPHLELDIGGTVVARMEYLAADSPGSQLLYVGRVSSVPTLGHVHTGNNTLHVADVSGLVLGSPLVVTARVTAGYSGPRAVYSPTIIVTPYAGA